MILLKERTTFVGVDLAWRSEKNHTGIAIARETADGAALSDVSSGIASFGSVVGYVSEHATSNTVIAIDAPLIITNSNGQRPCETLVSKKFGSRHASCHSSNLESYPSGGPARLVEMLSKAGFSHDLDLHAARKRGGRWLFEVYPHPAQIVLFDLPSIIRYKKGSVSQKRAGLSQLRRYLIEVLPRACPSLSPGQVGINLANQDLMQLRGQALKEYEDLLDAWFCAYLSLHVWWWGAERNEILGDLISGYIVVPTHPLQ